MKVSICIPTCDRLDLLKEAIDSCLSQIVLPDELVIGDDSKSDKTAAWIGRLASPVPISYRRNQPRLGQAENVNSLYQRARGTHFILLHDDDVLMPDAVALLSRCWEKEPQLDAAFGKQYVISHDGKIDFDGSDQLNYDYSRTPDRAGCLIRPWEAGILQQFPNDGFMIRSHIARAVGCRKEAGAGVDFDFGLRLSLKNSHLFFLDRFVSKYRVTKESVSSSATSDTALQGYRILSSTSVPLTANDSKRRQLARFAPIAMMQAIRRDQKEEAWKIYRSEYHGWGKRLSAGGVHRLVRLLLPSSAKRDRAA